MLADVIRPFSVVCDGVIEDMIAVARNSPEGAFVEVGVYQGGTAFHLHELAKQQGRKLYLYDTFTGIPYKGDLDAHSVGDFNDTDYERVKSWVPFATVIKGVFPASAVPMGYVAFAHIDCDQYQSVRDSIEYLRPLMVTGGVIWFDDYGALLGASTAVEECLGKPFFFSKSKTGKLYVTI